MLKMCGARVLANLARVLEVVEIIQCRWWLARAPLYRERERERAAFAAAPLLKSHTACSLCKHLTWGIFACNLCIATSRVLAISRGPTPHTHQLARVCGCDIGASDIGGQRRSNHGQYVDIEAAAARYARIAWPSAVGPRD
jgi:hypothetical protein